MRWGKNLLKHDAGDTRIITEFSWLPLTINEETRWLEFSNIKQRYYPYSGWVNERWMMYKT